MRQNPRSDDKGMGVGDQASRLAPNQHGDSRNDRTLHGTNMPSSDHISHIEPTTTETFKKELMKVTIDLGEGAQETILVREGETPDMVARAFASKFDLTQGTELLLREQIELNLNQLQLSTSQGTLPASRQVISSQAYGSKMQLRDESEGEVGEAESDEERTRISNINSMGPRQWSNHRQGALDYLGEKSKKHHFVPDPQAPIIRKEKANIFVQDDFTYSSGVGGAIQLDMKQPASSNYG